MGILFALTSALSWGSGDFCGGVAARKITQFQVLYLASTSSMVFLLVLAIIQGESFPSLRNVFLALSAGTSGAAGLSALYRGLSSGSTARVAPVAGVIGAIVPMVVGGLVEGLPGSLQIGGFFSAFVGIWLIARQEAPGLPGKSSSLGLAVLAGIGFGGFLTLIAQIDGADVFSPLVAAKFASWVFAVLLLLTRKSPLPGISAHPAAVLSGFLDAGGNLFYLLAVQLTRLDVVAVLSSLYPAATVLLSGIIFKEKVSVLQWIGIAVCIAAIVMITL
jgi:drug/metabolite transporter (DMT)-like permease